MTQDVTAPIVPHDLITKGVIRGVPMRTMVGPALKLAQELEAIV
jgi:26S proteasome regulatory subunit N12